MTADPPLAVGWVDPELASEFPELALVTTVVAGSGGRTARAVKDQLKRLANRFTGARAITLRQEHVPWAYRVFFRHVGIDPDDKRTPIEQIALDRLRHGGFKSRGRVEDALLIATLETAVPVVAFDADRIDGQLGLRLTAAGEMLGGSDRSLAGGQLAIADRTRVVQVLFGDAADGITPDRGTSRIALGAVRVKGVPAVSVEEALWMAADLLQNEA
jgi:DNA/RNA-binding domain of Phe-tRNA-synthetase-like protein